jgi:hypothetical protein
MLETRCRSRRCIARGEELGVIQPIVTRFSKTLDVNMLYDNVNDHA